jgi:hypothetical protein
MYFTFIEDNINLVLLLLLVPLFILIILMFLNAKLKTLYSLVSLNISLVFFRKEIKWEDVESVELKSYNPLKYGYGYRYNFKEKRTIYNVQGSIGLFINGKENVMIGISSKSNIEEFLKSLSIKYPKLKVQSS